jgi:DNA/RNA-binding domain of Phe-tRNA-synthetase-like protein
MQLTIDPHPLLAARVFAATWPGALETIAAPSIDAARDRHYAAPVKSDDAVRAAIRDLLRHAGFKPTGRSKPSSEYLLKAAEDGLPVINAAVDAGNAVSLHSGLPISVIDLDRAQGPLRIGVADDGMQYVFNRSGQAIDVGQLLCLFDAEGPCANAVKDAQRTKTDGSSTRTLTVVWGAMRVAAHVDATLAWYRALLATIPGVTVADIAT